MVATAQTGIEQQRGTCALICSRDTLDGVYPALVLAITARRIGMDAKVFFTFQGLNVLRKGWVKKVKLKPLGFLGAIPGMPTLATWLMKHKIEKAEIPPLDDLLEMARLEGVTFVACRMTLDIMNIDDGALAEGVETQNAEDFMKLARSSPISLFT